MVPKDSSSAWTEAMAHYQAGRSGAANAALQRVLELEPRHAPALHLAGVLAEAGGRPEAGIALLERALAVEPSGLECRLHLGMMLLKVGRVQEAAPHLRAVSDAWPAATQAHRQAAKAYKLLGLHQEQLECLQRSVAVQASDPGTFLEAGLALKALNRLPEAEAAFLQAGVLAPTSPVAPFNRGVILNLAGRFVEAAEAYQAALAVDPGFHRAASNLLTVLLKVGDVEGVRELCRPLRFDREPLPDHGFLASLNYDPEYSAEALSERHFAWGRVVESRSTPLLLPPRDIDSGRKLRVGYVSGDFKRHSCAFFIEPLWRQHDRSQVEIWAYSTTEAPDDFTVRLQGLADHWWEGPLEAMAGRIAADHIDILLDLSGHTHGDQLAVFAQQPAPIQVAWLGYPNTTGLTRIQARMTDSHSDPPGHDPHATERLLRLDPTFLCYEPPQGAPPVSAPPHLRNGYPTFGSFNALAKVNQQVLTVWAELAARLPEARFCLKSLAFSDPRVVARWQERLERAGLPPARVDLLPPVYAIEGHLGAYAALDIALDPFPYAGTTTTCEALWMGVPVVTLAGDRHAARVGVSLLHALGLEELIAADPAEYVAKAAALARDPDRVAALRQNLRNRMAASPLCDGSGFAKRFESGLRQLWVEYCGERLGAGNPRQ